MPEAKVTCPKCGNEDYPSNRLCWQCGAALSPDQPVAGAEVFPEVPTGAFALAGGLNLSAKPQFSEKTVARPRILSVLVALQCLYATFTIMSAIMAIELRGVASAATAQRSNGDCYVQLLISGAIFYTAYKLWHGVNWARVVFTVLLVLSGIQIAFALLLVSSPSAPAIARLVYIMMLGLNFCWLYVLNSKETRAFCTN